MTDPTPLPDITPPMEPSSRPDIDPAGTPDEVPSPPADDGSGLDRPGAD